MASHNLRQSLKPLLLPLSFVYGVITGIRNRLFNSGILRSVEFNFPVISVGNITVGGTGKTPHVEYLLRLLHNSFNIALLSRGYKRKTNGFIIAGEKSTPEEIGDESFQVWKKFSNIKVAVDESRVHGINKLKEIDPGIQCIILDDAFQHRYVNPGLSILLIDYYRPINKDTMLPYGNLRESGKGIHRANIVIVTKVPHAIRPIEMRLWIKELNLYPYQYLYFTSFQYTDLKPVYNQKQKKLTLEELEEIKPGILMVTGIANAEPIYDRLITCCSYIEHLEFPDHYEYTQSDLAEIGSRFNSLAGDNKIIITTEKDAVKLRNIAAPTTTLRDSFYLLPVEVIFLDNKQDEFNMNIRNYIEKNKKLNHLKS